jgi:hypothetical protein
MFRNALMVEARHFMPKCHNNTVSHTSTPFTNIWEVIDLLCTVIICYSHSSGEVQYIFTCVSD